MFEVSHEIFRHIKLGEGGCVDITFSGAGMDTTLGETAVMIAGRYLPE
jgi:hypothetical protein